MDKQNYGLRQKVTEGELNQLITYAEAGMEAVAADIVPGGGVVQGMAVTVNTGFTVTVASGKARDSAGARASIAANTNLDLSAYKPTTAGTQKWVTLYAKRNRITSDPRTDGLGVAYFFQLQENVQLVVVPGTDAVSAVKPARQGTDGVVLCDVLLKQSASSIITGDIDVGRREVYSPGSSIAATQVTYSRSGGYAGGVVQVQAALDDIDTRFVIHTTAGDPHTQYVLEATRGAAGGVATLDGTGKVPSAQLPPANYIPTAEKAAPFGVASLDGAGKVLTTQLPQSSPGTASQVTYSRSAGYAGSVTQVQAALDDIDTRFVIHTPAGDPHGQYILDATRGVGGGVATLDGAGRLAQDAFTVGGRAPGVNAGNLAYYDSAGRIQDASQLNGWFPSQSAAGTTVAVRDVNGRLAGDILGNAATVGGRFPGNANGIATLDNNFRLNESQAPTTVTLTRMIMWASF